MSDAPEVLQATPEPSGDKCKDDCKKDETSKCCDGHEQQSPEEKENKQEEPLPEPKLLEDGRYDLFPSEPMKCIKKIIREGTGSIPPKGSLVRVHYTGTLEDGKEFDTSRTRDEFEFKLGVGRVIRGWDIGLASMKVGEISDLILSPEFAYGEQGSQPSIPPNATLTFNVELLTFSKDPETIEEKLAYGLERKNAGNECIGKTQWIQATSEYDKGIEVLKGMKVEHKPPKEPEPEPEKKEGEIEADKEEKTEDDKSGLSAEQRTEHRTTLIALLLNKALSTLKAHDLHACYRTCEEILRIDPKNAKAWFRRGLAFKTHSEYEYAIGDFTEALKNAPGDKLITAELERTKALHAKRTGKEKETFGSLFEKMAKMDEEEKKEKEKRDKEAEVIRLKEEAVAKRKAEIRQKKREARIKELERQWLEAQAKKKEEEEKKKKEEEEKKEEKEEKKEEKEEKKEE